MSVSRETKILKKQFYVKVTDTTKEKETRYRAMGAGRTTGMEANLQRESCWSLETQQNTSVCRLAILSRQPTVGRLACS